MKSSGFWPISTSPVTALRARHKSLGISVLRHQMVGFLAPAEVARIIPVRRHK
jgi:hypothetical protein